MEFKFDIEEWTKKVKEAVKPACEAVGPIVNQVTEKSCDVFNKGKIQTDILKLQYQISQDEKALNHLYTEAGKLAYQQKVDENAADQLAEQFLLIQTAEEKITAAKDEIEELKEKIEEITANAALRAEEGYACKCCCEECAEETDAPAEEAVAPVEEAAAPVEEAAAPVEEATAPVEEAAAPAEEAAAPAEEAEKPAKKKGTRKR